MLFSHQDLIAFLDKMVSINTLHALESKLTSNQMTCKEAEAGVFACFSPTAPFKEDLRVFQSIPRVTLVGHDWGGALVWNMAQFFPERVR